MSDKTGTKEKYNFQTAWFIVAGALSILLYGLILAFGFLQSLPKKFEPVVHFCGCLLQFAIGVEAALQASYLSK